MIGKLEPNPTYILWSYIYKNIGCLEPSATSAAQVSAAQTL